MVNYPTTLDDDDSLYDVEDYIDTVLAVHHNNPKDAIIALETKVGIDNSSVVTTHEYKINTHLAATNNPHSVVWADVSSGHTEATHNAMSVTMLTDVSSFGSGDIITDGERSGLHAESHTLTSHSSRTHSELSDAPVDAHHDEVHTVASSGPHDEGSLTIGHVLRASAVDAFSFAQLGHGDLSGIGSNAHSVIDTHLGSSANPHSVVWSDVSSGHDGAAHGSISVTDLSDVTGVGSGIIISGSERTGLHTEGHVLATTGPHTNSLPLTDLASYVQGSIIKGGGTDWEALAKGTEDYVLKAGATDIGWGQVDWDELSGKPGSFTPSAHEMVDSVHTDSLLTIGHVIRASGASAFAWAQLAHGDLSGIGSNVHSVIDTHLESSANPHSVEWSDVSAGHIGTAHNSISVTDLSDVTGVGSGIIISGAERTGLHTETHIIESTGPHTGTCTAGQVLKGTAENVFSFGQLAHSQLNDDESTQHLVLPNTMANVLSSYAHGDLSDAPVDAHHDEAHQLGVSGGVHTGTLPLTDLIEGASGDIIIRGATDWEALPKGSDSDVLTLASGVPVWQAAGAPGAHTLDSGSHDDVNSITEAKGQLLWYSGPTNKWDAIPPAGTVGHVLRCSNADGMISFAELQHSNLGGVTPDLHHAQSHNNTYHSTNYEAANANIQGHVASPGVDVHHARSHNNTYHSTNYEVANANIQSHVASPAADAHHVELHASSHSSGQGDAVNHDNLAGFESGEHFTQSQITTVGALASGSIAVGFTTIPVARTEAKCTATWPSGKTLETSMPASPTDVQLLTAQGIGEYSDVAVPDIFALANGASYTTGWTPNALLMPSGDTDCEFKCSIGLPANWRKSSATLKIWFTTIGYGTYSVQWWIYIHGANEVLTFNMLSGSTAYDFTPTAASGRLSLLSIPLTSLAAGKHLAFWCKSDASNGVALYITSMWVE